MDKNLALQVKNLSVMFNNKNIIEDLSFNVNKGETLVILGPNGAGKTTLLRALLGIIPYKGNVEWEGSKISYLPPKELLQRKEILPLTIEDFYGLKEIPKHRIIESLISVGLSKDDLKKRIAYLSTGEFQRLSIGWSVADNPDTILFDEPISGIDIGGTEEIFGRI